MTPAIEAIQVLAVNCRPGGNCEGLDITELDTFAAVMAAVRVLHFDVLLTTACVDGNPIWSLARKLRAARPKLRWWLIGQGLPMNAEIVARTIGVSRILDSVPDAEMLYEAFRPANARRLPPLQPVDGPLAMST